MIVDSNKYNGILYCIVAAVVMFGFKRWIYGGFVSILAVFILLQSVVLKESSLYK